MSRKGVLVRHRDGSFSSVPEANSWRIDEVGRLIVSVTSDEEDDEDVLTVHQDHWISVGFSPTQRKV